MFFNNKFILASSSNSRYKLLKKNNLSFIKIKPQCDEDYLKKRLIKKKQEPHKISLELARLKSQSISKIKKNTLVVGSDTIINFNGKIINKAKNIKDAKKKYCLCLVRFTKYTQALLFIIIIKRFGTAPKKPTLKLENLTKKKLTNIFQQQSLSPNVSLHSIPTKSSAACKRPNLGNPANITDLPQTQSNFLMNNKNL